MRNGETEMINAQLEIDAIELSETVQYFYEN